MRHFIYPTIILILSSVIYWQWLDKPEPQIIVHKQSIDTELLQEASDALAAADATIDICFTTHDELKYNLKLCEADYLNCEAKRGEPEVIELDPIIIGIDKCEVECIQPAPKKKPSLRHMFTIMASTRLVDDTGEVNIQPMSDDIRFVPGLGYQYFLTDHMGIGLMYQPRATAGLTFSVRF